MATLNFLRCIDNEFLAKHRTAVLLDDVAARRHRFAAGGDSNKDITIGLVSGVVARVCCRQEEEEGGGSRF